MFHRFIMIPLVTICLSSSPTFADDESHRELLIEVTGDELAQVRRNSEAFLKERLYWAKDYTIVRMSEDVLLNEDVFTMSVPEYKPLLLQRDSMTRTSDMGYLWNGTLISPVPSERVSSSREISEEKASALRNIATTISFSAAYVERDTATGQYVSLHDQIDMRPTEAAKPPKYQKSMSMSAEIQLIRDDVSNNAKIVIYRLENDPDYMLVYVEDKDKLYPSRLTDNPEIEGRREAHRAYIASLPMSPSDRIAAQRESFTRKMEESKQQNDLARQEAIQEAARATSRSDDEEQEQ